MQQKEFFEAETINLPSNLSALIQMKGKGGSCPHCHQQTLMRPIALSKKEIAPLKFAASKADGTVTPKQVNRECGNVGYNKYTNLKYWGFLKKADGKKAWKITDIGLKFIRDELRVPEVVWVYNGHARNVPKEMKGKWVCYSELVTETETTRETIAASSVPVEVATQSRLI